MPKGCTDEGSGGRCARAARKRDFMLLLTITTFKLQLKLQSTIFKCVNRLRGMHVGSVKALFKSSYVILCFFVNCLTH